MRCLGDALLGLHPCRNGQVATMPSMPPPRLRIGHGYGHAATQLAATVLAMHQRHFAPAPPCLPCRHAVATLHSSATPPPAPPPLPLRAPPLPPQAATTPIFAGAVATPLCPHGPGHLPRAQRGLPLARNKLGFGTALLQHLNATILTTLVKMGK